MTEISLPSGATATINVAAWRDAKRMKNAIERELAASGGLNIPTVLLVDSSDAVDAAIWPCLVRCLYNGEKITEQTFDKSSARADYYDIVIACVKENLGPLAQSLLSKLAEYGLLKKQADLKEGQKSTSPMTSASSPAASPLPDISAGIPKAS